MPTKVQPTDAQVETFLQAICIYKDSDATIRGEMDDEDGTMIIYVVEDGMQMFARFGADGEIEGNWIC